MYVVEAGSLIKASDNHDIPRATLSRNLKQLEDDLGVILIERTTRSLHLTEVGELFYHKANELLLQFEALEKEVCSEQQKVSGKLTFAMPYLFANLGASDITAFRQSYPDLNITIRSLETGLDSALKLGFDIAIQVGRPADSNCILMPLGSVEFDYYCSTEYAQLNGVPSTPDELVNHDCIYSPLKQNDTKNWKFGEQIVKPRFACQTDNHQLALSLAQQGLGICCIPVFSVHPSMSTNTLTPIFDKKYRFELPLFAIYPSKRHLPIKLKILLERLKKTVPKALEELESNDT